MCIFIKLTLRLLILNIFGSVLINLGFAEKIENKFVKTHECEQTYGTTLTTSTNTRSYLACTILCGKDDSCMSVTYNPDNKTCKTNSDTMACPPISECTPNVYYGEKKFQQGLSPNGCTTPTLNLRLCDGNGTGTSSPDRGRLEVCLNNAWGTVCDDYWHGDYWSLNRGHNKYINHNANIVCTMLGYVSGTSHSNAYYGQGSGPIWMDDVDCTGTETSIFDCKSTEVGQHNCNHGDDISVICSNP